MSALFAVLLLGVPPVAAAPKTTAAAKPTPKELGQFKNWIAASYDDGGHTVCYAFTRAGTDNPLNGTGPVLSVTDRPGGRDQVALSGGPAFAKDAPLTVQVDQAGLDFYTAGRDAFARDNAAAVAAFQRGSTATAQVPAAHGAATTLSFSLSGFTAAHDAIEKACPAP